MDEQVAAARSPWLVTPVANRIDRLDAQIDVAMPDAEMALTAIDVAPGMLGADGPQRYLVLFTTPVEARGRVGFPGNYAELLVDNGKLSMPRFGRISELEQEGIPGDQRTLSGPPDYVARYTRFDVAATWRNITMSPDFVEVAASRPSCTRSRAARRSTGCSRSIPRAWRRSCATPGRSRSTGWTSR